MEKGLYLEHYSNSEEMVAWENLYFYFTDEGKILINEALSILKFLFDVYRVSYSKKAKDEGRYVWKESFNTRWLDDKRGIEIFIVPRGKNTFEFAVELLETISKLDTIMELNEYIIKNTNLDFHRTTEIDQSMLASVCKMIKEYIVFIKEKGECSRYMRKDNLSAFANKR